MFVEDLSVVFEEVIVFSEEIGWVIYEIVSGVM